MNVGNTLYVLLNLQLKSIFTCDVFIRLTNIVIGVMLLNCHLKLTVRLRYLPEQQQYIVILAKNYNCQILLEIVGIIGYLYG